MAKYEHLSIYKSTYDLLILYHKLQLNFPKAFKYTLGQSTIDVIEQALLEIISINNQEQKNFHKLLLLLEQLKIKTRVLKSLQVFSQKVYLQLAEHIVTLLKQAQGWQSYSQKVRYQNQKAMAI